MHPKMLVTLGPQRKMVKSGEAIAWYRGAFLDATLDMAQTSHTPATWECKGQGMCGQSPQLCSWAGPEGTRTTGTALVSMAAAALPRRTREHRQQPPHGHLGRLCASSGCLYFLSPSG